MQLVHGIYNDQPPTREQVYLNIPGNIHTVNILVCFYDNVNNIEFFSDLAYFSFMIKYVQSILFPTAESEPELRFYHFVVIGRLIKSRLKRVRRNSPSAPCTQTTDNSATSVSELRFLL